MKKTNALKVAAVLLLAAFAACNPVTEPENLKAGALTANFSNADGSPSFLNSTNAVASTEGSTYTVNATETTSQGSSELSVSGIPVQSAVPYTASSSSFPNLKIDYYDGVAQQQYRGSCTITITQTSPTLTGTFTGVLSAPGARDSIRQITSASFNANYQ